MIPEGEQPPNLGKLLIDALMIACGANEAELPAVHKELEDIGMPTSPRGMVDDVRKAIMDMRKKTTRP